MAIVVTSDSSLYATPLDMTSLGATGTDAQLQSAIDLAMLLVDGYTGTHFSEPNIDTKVFPDQRTRAVVLPDPFADITNVSVNGSALDSTLWTLETWGIRLFPYVSVGFPDIYGYGSTVGDALRYGSSYGFGYGLSQDAGYDVSVTATWGYAAVPAAVKQATIILAFDALSGSDFSGLDPSTVMIMVEGYRIQRDPNFSVRSTGDVKADRLLDRLRANPVGIL